MNSSYSAPFINKLSMLLLALLPILTWYKIPFPVGLGHTLVLFLSLYVITIRKFRINVIPSTFWLIFAYISIMWMYNNDFQIWTVLPPGGWIFFIFVLALLWGVITFDLVLLQKYMRWIVLISGILFWIQFILFTMTGSSQFCFVPNLTGSFTYEGFTYADVVERHLRGLPSSIFLEKSYLAYYYLTYLALIWFNNNTNQNFNKEIIFIIATLLASRSGTALVGFFVLFIVKLFMMYRTANYGRRLLFLIIILPLAIGLTAFYISTEIGEQMLSRTTELTDENTSGYTRIVSGYLMFDQLTPMEKIVGIPDARNRFGFEKANGNFIFYVNGVQSILISLGLVGAILYFLFYVSIFRKVSLTSKLCIILLLVMSLLESNYLNPYMMILTIVPCSELYLLRNRNKYENDYVGLRY